MQEFSFSRLTFTIRGKTTLLVPAYKGSTLRGGFGHAFRRVVCAFRDKDCRDCLLRSQCIYAWVFETPIPQDAVMMRKYTAAPHPFVIEPPIEEQLRYQPEDEFSFHLILIGRAVDYLAYFIYAFEELGHIGLGQGKGKFQLVQVSEDWPTSAVKVIYHGESKKLHQGFGPVMWSQIVDDPAPKELSLTFLSPARVKYENSLTKDLEFHVFFRNLLRRISLLSYFHCQNKLDDSRFKDLIDQATKIKTVKKALYWEDWERWSNRQNTAMMMGGLMGEITYQGDFTPFWPYIRLGEYVHVGKGSSFGLGRYEVKNHETTLRVRNKNE